jgi:hypothetical protein
MVLLRFALGQEVCVGDPNPAQKFHLDWQITLPCLPFYTHAAWRNEAETTRRRRNTKNTRNGLR